MHEKVKGIQYIAYLYKIIFFLFKQYNFQTNPLELFGFAIVEDSDSTGVETGRCRAEMVTWHSVDTKVKLTALRLLCIFFLSDLVNLESSKCHVINTRVFYLQSNHMVFAYFSFCLKGNRKFSLGLQGRTTLNDWCIMLVNSW